ncbi:MAG: ribosome recycling factor [Bacteroidales bacterium]|nr:ribosome recycling factor [Bacteroidales bacterium]
MNAQIKNLLDETAASMSSSVDFLEKDLKKLRAGKATPQMLEGVKVDYYGTLTPIEQVGNINTPAANQITVQPWDKSAIGPINKAIIDSNLGFTPKVEADLLRITLPPLTEERRKDIMKSVKKEAEDSKVSIRNIRRNYIEKIKKTKDNKENPATEDEIKQAEKDVQDKTDKFIKRIDEIVAEKEKEVMTV